MAGSTAGEHALGVHLFGKRKLDQDAVDAIVGIELVDEAQQIVSGAVDGGCVHPAVEAEVMAGGDFAFYVQLGGGILADEDGGEAGADMLVQMQIDDLGAEFGKDFVANFQAVQDAREHEEIIAWGRNVVRVPCAVTGEPRPVSLAVPAVLGAVEM